MTPFAFAFPLSLRYLPANLIAKNCQINFKIYTNPWRIHPPGQSPRWFTEFGEGFNDLVKEFHRYRLVIEIPGIRGLIVRTNSNDAVAYFNRLLELTGFSSRVNGFVQLVQ